MPPGLPPLKSILDKHSSILNVSKKWRQLAVKDHTLVAYQHPPILRTPLVQAQFAQKQQLSYKGNCCCLQVHCKTCQNIQPIKTFKGSVIGKTLLIKAPANSKMANVVYVIECLTSKKTVCWKTENVVDIRMNGHRSDIKHQCLDTPVANDFNFEGHSLWVPSIFLIEQIHREEVNFAKQK